MSNDGSISVEERPNSINTVSAGVYYHSATEVRKTSIVTGDSYVVLTENLFDSDGIVKSEYRWTVEIDVATDSGTQSMRDVVKVLLFLGHKPYTIVGNENMIWHRAAPDR